MAKQAASVVLQDDRFETVAAAVEEGRIIFDNIRRFVFYLFSCNAAEILLLLVAGLAGLPLPLLPLQLLWLNLVTDTFPALALAFEPGSPSVMRRPPRAPGDAILSRSFLVKTMAYALVITLPSLAAYLWALSREPSVATTVAFVTLGCAQIVHLVNARRDEDSGVLPPIGVNRYAVAGAGTAAALMFGALYLPPVASLLDVVPLGGTELAVVLAAAVTPALAGPIIERLRVTRGGAAPAAAPN